MPTSLPPIAVYNLLILDTFVKKSHSLDEVIQAINNYPEDTHREGFVCKGMMRFVTVFQTFDHLKLAIEQRFDEEGGRKGAESYRNSMEKLESWYDE